MNDHDIEDLLRRYRPSAPPGALRASIHREHAAGTSRAWPWVAAAAALLAGICLTQRSTSELYRRAEGPPVREALNLNDLPALRSVVEQDDLLRARLEILARAEASEDAAIQSTEGPS